MCIQIRQIFSLKIVLQLARQISLWQHLSDTESVPKYIYLDLNDN